MLFGLLRSTIYATKFEHDDRVAESTWEVFGMRFGWIGFDPMFWLQLVGLVAMQTSVNIIAALIIYQYIILPRQQQKRDNGSKAVTSATSFLVGFGVICPLLMVVPFGFLELLDLRNKTMMLASAASSSLIFFRCTEAMFDTTPPFAKESRSTFVMYYASTVQFCFDPKTNQVIRASATDVAKKAGAIASLALQAIVLYSVLHPRNYELITVSETGFAQGWVVHLINNFVMASITSVSLEVGSMGIGLGLTLMSGINTMDINDNPLTMSKSPSEFWNLRWNTLVSHGLKRGVFVPLKKNGFSKPFAAMATFGASGLLHEYILVVIDYWNIKETGHVSFSGLHLAFFAWNGVVLSLEHFCKDWRIFTWIDKTFPRPIKTTLVILTVLPLAHLFTQVYVDTGFYTSFCLGFPRIEFYGMAQS